MRRRDDARLHPRLTSAAAEIVFDDRRDVDFDAVLDRAIVAWADIEIDGLEWQQKLRAEWDRDAVVE